MRPVQYHIFIVRLTNGSDRQLTISIEMHVKNTVIPRYRYIAVISTRGNNVLDLLAYSTCASYLVAFFIRSSRMQLYKYTVKTQRLATLYNKTLTHNTAVLS